MIIIDQQIPPNCDISLHGDIHEGNRMCSADSLEKVFWWIMRERYRRFCFMGDEIEAIMTDDKRYSHEASTDPIPMQQAKSIIKRYKPVHRRGLVWLYGNHAEQLKRFGNLAEWIAGELGIPYGTTTCKLHLKDKHGLIAKLFLCHPSRFCLSSNAKDYEQRLANMKAALKMKLKEKASDCLVMAVGHTHRLLVVEPAQKLLLHDDGHELRQTYLGGGKGDEQYIEPDQRWYANTGSFLRTYAVGIDGYAEKYNFDPVELGHVVVEIRDRRVVAVRKVVIGA